MSLDAVRSNPFALMIAPETVFAAIERSERLARLKSTICRPLDKPRPEKPIVELAAFDDEIATIDVVEPEEALEAVAAAAPVDEDDTDAEDRDRAVRFIDPTPATDWGAMTSFGD